MKKLISLFAIIALTATFAFAQKISAEEQKIIDFIDKNSASAIPLLEKIVNIESPTENLKGVRDVGKVFETEFKSIGFETKWLEMPAEMKRGGHFFGERKGKKGKRLLLLGHIDTVLSGEKFRIDGTKAFGTGSADMKAGCVVLFYALKALQASGALKDTQIIVLLTGDEENSVEPIELSRKDMIDAAKRSDLVLSFENGGSNIATVARRGSSDWTLEVTAKTGHSSQIFKESMGNGAIFEASRILNQFYETLKGEKYLTFNPSIISGGTTVEAGEQTLTSTGKGNVVPAKAIVRGDLRFISEAQKEMARAKMREIVAKSLPGTEAKIKFGDGIPSMSPREENYVLLEKLNQVSQDLGFGEIKAQDPGERGAGDISYVAEIIPGLDGLGATGGKSHAKGEFTELDTMSRQIKRTALLLYRLTR